MKSRAARALHAPRIPCAGRLRRARAAVSTPARTAGRRRPARRAALAGPGRVRTDGRRGPARHHRCRSSVTAPIESRRRAKHQHQSKLIKLTQAARRKRVINRRTEVLTPLGMTTRTTVLNAVRPTLAVLQFSALDRRPALRRSRAIRL